MNGKIVGIVLMISALAAGAAMYYLQVYGFYEEVADSGGEEVRLLNLTSGQSEPILYDSFQAIDADSSPIRYRACFQTSHSQAMLTETYELVDGMEPRNAPGWFDCFDAGEIQAALEDGSALAFMGVKNIHYGVDRIVAIDEDGRGWMWHELNDCGDKAYDGTVTGEECPPRPAPAD